MNVIEHGITYAFCEGCKAIFLLAKDDDPTLRKIDGLNTWVCDSCFNNDLYSQAFKIRMN